MYIRYIFMFEITIQCHFIAKDHESNKILKDTTTTPLTSMQEMTFANIF